MHIHIRIYTHKFFVYILIINDCSTVDNSHVTRRQRPDSGYKELTKLQQEEEEFWQLAEGFNMSKPGSVELYFDMLSSRVNQMQVEAENE